MNTVGPSYGPNALLYWMRKPRLTRLMPESSIHATRNERVRSASNNSFITHAYLGCRSKTPLSEVTMLSHAARNSVASPSLRLASAISSSDASNPVLKMRSPSRLSNGLFRHILLLPAVPLLPWTPP